MDIDTLVGGLEMGTMSAGAEGGGGGGSGGAAVGGGGSDGGGGGGGSVLEELCGDGGAGLFVVPELVTTCLLGIGAF